MKLTFTFFFILCFSIFSKAQTWQPLGPNDFDQASYSSVTYTNIAFSGTTPYVVYSDQGNSGKATVQKFNGTAWEVVVAAGFSAGQVAFTSIAFNGTTPYVVYRDGGNSNKATVMKLNAGRTAWEVVGTAGFSAGTAAHTSIGFNGTTPYVVYQDVGKATVMKLNAGGTAWEVVGTAGFSAGTAEFTNIAFNGTTPYVVYRDAGNGFKATVMKLNAGGTAWEAVGTAGFSAGQANYTSIAFNGTIPYVVYQDVVNSNKATVMKLNAGGTAWEVVGTAGFSAGSAQYTSIAFNGTTPYVVYRDVGNSLKATVMKLNAGGTAWEAVGMAGFSAGSALYTSIASNGSTPYVVYQDGGNGLKATVMKLNVGGTAWEVVGTAGFSAGQATFTSIAFNGSTPYVVYRDGGNSFKATVMKPNAGGTAWEVVGTAGFSAGQADYTSIAFNGTTPYVVYQDAGNSFKATVMKLNAGGTVWEVVGTAGFSAGQVFDTSIAFNGTIPYVVYRDGGNSNNATVMKLNAGGTAWEVVGTAGFSEGTAEYTSIAFNGTTPYVVYTDGGNSFKATVMKLNAGGTDWEAVGTAGFSSGTAVYTSIAFNGTTPYVVYTDIVNSGKATVMKLNAGGTAWEVVGTAGFSSGQAEYTGIAFNGTTPYVVYRDAGNGSKATVMKLNAGGTAWEVVGTEGFSAGTATYTGIISNGSELIVAYSSGGAFAKSFSLPDLIGPTATIVVSDNALRVGETSLVTITFSEAVTGFTIADLIVANGTLTSLNSSDGGVTWTATLTPDNNVEDATNEITLNNTGVTDLSSNAGTGSTNSNNYSIDTQRPTATIVVSDDALRVGETSLVTITFSEVVTGFTNANLAVVNGTLTSVSTVDGGITFTATLTPTNNIEDATNEITLDNTGVSDLSSNAGTGTTNSNNYSIDTQRPTATIVLSDNALRVGETSLVTITFSEAVTGLTVADFTVANGTLTSLSSADGGITFTTTLTPTNNIEDATNVITLDNTGVSDLSSNAGTGTTNSNNYAIDTQRPTVLNVTSTQPDGNYGLGTLIPIQITFSEIVNVTGTPQLQLETGLNDRQINYASGSGSNTLTFNYIVQTGDESTDLDYTSSTALILNGGLINDGLGNPGTLTLPNVGATGSLSLNKNLTILSTLPVKLISFDIKQEYQKQVNLTWKTATETNNDYFKVSKSRDGKTFETVGNVKSKGNGANYELIDYFPYAGTSYYKLIQTDLDGKTEELGIKPVTLASLKESNLMVYPNPITNGILNIKDSGLQGIKELTVYDLAGKEVFREKVNFSNGASTLKLNNSLSKGTYILSIGEKGTKIKILVE